MNRSALADGAHVMTLVGFALAQPLYDLLGRNASFFVFHRAQPLDILLIVLLLSLVVPGLLAGLVLLLPGRRRTVPVVLTLLTALVLTPILGRIGALPAVVVVGLALLGGAAFSWCRCRYSLVRSFLLALTPAFVVFPALFLSGAQVARLLNTAAAAEVVADVKSSTPVVMLVFDEFPLASLLDDKREIDAVRFPHFAALARGAHWFRNATTSHPWTTHAVPSLVTGKYIQPGLLSTAQDHPHSLFTLLAGSHEMRVQEYASLCPEEINVCKPQPSFDARLKAVLRDLAIVELHLLLPRQWTKSLPAVDVEWGHFGDVRQALLDRPRLVSEFLDRLTPPQGRPGLHFLHIGLPHTPYSFLPSGKAYGRDLFIVGLGRDKCWCPDGEIVAQAQQRHLLQVGYADRIVGQVLARLKETGLYDDCLLIVTADHGCSFQPGGPYRKITATNYADILRVPLFVKTPRQQVGQTTERNVQHIDVLPTIADILDVRLPWPVDGRSMFADASQEWTKKRVLENGQPFEYGPTLNDSWGGHARQLALFGAGSWQRLAQYGPYPSLIGTAVAGKVKGTSRLTGRLLDAACFDQVDTSLSFVPARIRGGLTTESTVALAVAVNGVVRATTHVRTGGERETVWEALVSEDSFRDGKNVVEVFEIGGDATLRRVAGSATTDAQGDYRLDGAALIGPNGQRIPIRKHVFEGCLDQFHADEACVTFAGWSADPRGHTLPERVLLFADGEPLHSGPLHAERPDIVKLWHRDVYRWCGFSFSFPRERFAGLESGQLRLFAVSADGRASELRYPDWYQRRDLRPLKR